MEKTPAPKRRRYDAAFRAEALRLAGESRSTPAAARALNIHPELLYQWQRAARAPLPADLAARHAFLRVQIVNEGGQPVYFDSLTLRHPRPALYISQENHYYPFGLALGGAAANTVPAEAISKAQYNGGSLLEDELLDAGEAEGANYATPYRRYDPTIGRLLGVDPLADMYADQGTGNFAGNDPVNQNDPTGAFISDGDPGARGHDRFVYDTGRYGQFDAEGGSGSAPGQGLNGPRLTDFQRADSYFSGGGLVGYEPQFNRWGQAGYWTYGGSSGKSSSGSIAKGVDLAGVNHTTEFHPLSGEGGSPQGSGNWFTDHSLEIKETAQNAIAAGAGYKEFQAAELLAVAPDPTLLTKAAAVYFALDGAVRVVGATVRTVGVWTDWENNTDLARAPTNLLGVVGYVVNGVSGGSFYMGSRTQVLFEMQGDLINSRRAITNGINTFSDAWQVVVPSYGAYNKAMQIR